MIQRSSFFTSAISLGSVFWGWSVAALIRHDIEANLVGTRVIDFSNGRYRLLWVVIVGPRLLEHDNLVVLLVKCHDGFVGH